MNRFLIGAGTGMLAYGIAYSVSTKLGIEMGLPSFIMLTFMGALFTLLGAISD